MKYLIYQLKENERNRAFSSTSYLLKSGEIDSLDKINEESYNLIYEGTYRPEWESMDKNSILEEIFTIFNIERPADFKGHSLSVSDVVAFDYEDGNKSAYFVESIGFTRLGRFFKN